MDDILDYDERKLVDGAREHIKKARDYGYMHHGGEMSEKTLAILDKLLAERALLVRVAEAAAEAIPCVDWSVKTYALTDVQMEDVLRDHANKIAALKAALAAWRKEAT